MVCLVRTIYKHQQWPYILGPSLVCEVSGNIHTSHDYYQGYQSMLFDVLVMLDGISGVDLLMTTL